MKMFDSNTENEVEGFDVNTNEDVDVLGANNKSDMEVFENCSNNEDEGEYINLREATEKLRQVAEGSKIIEVPKGEPGWLPNSYLFSPNSAPFFRGFFGPFWGP